MAYIPKIFYPSNIPSTSGEVIYTVPASSSVIVKNIVMTNTSSEESAVTLHIVQSSDSPQNSNKILSHFSVHGNGISTIDCSIVMPANSYIFGMNGTSGAIVLTISGVEIS